MDRYRRKQSQCRGDEPDDESRRHSNCGVAVGHSPCDEDHRYRNHCHADDERYSTPSARVIGEDAERGHDHCGKTRDQWSVRRQHASEHEHPERKHDGGEQHQEHEQHPADVRVDKAGRDRLRRMASQWVELECSELSERVSYQNLRQVESVRVQDSRYEVRVVASVVSGGAESNSAETARPRQGPQCNANGEQAVSDERFGAVTNRPRRLGVLRRDRFTRQEPPPRERSECEDYYKCRESGHGKRCMNGIGELAEHEHRGEREDRDRGPRRQGAERHS